VINIIDRRLLRGYYIIMSFSVGIVGLPNVGKSTLFKALTKKKVDITPRPFTTINPNFGVVPVPDERLKKLTETINPEKTTPTVIEFIDIAGLVKGAHKGEGLGNQFLAQIRNCDAVLQIVRVFNGSNIENVLGEINPEKEIEVIKTELLMKDLEALENIISKLEHKSPPTEGGSAAKKKSGKLQTKSAEMFKKIKEEVSRGKTISGLDFKEEERLEIKNHQFLTVKPILFILNTNNKVKFTAPSPKHLVMNLKEEEEILELSEQDQKELEVDSKLNELIANCYKILNLITFFTVAGGKEIRAWTVINGSKAVEAGEAVHSDFKEKFIKADIVNWKELILAGSWRQAKKNGLIKTVGKDHIVQDGDVVEFKI
jgi:GTP-binding protein YchF